MLLKFGLLVSVILPYLAILTMQIKNGLDDNDYDFTLASFSATFTALTTAAAPLPASSISSSSIASLGNGQREPAQHNDLLKICVLLYDTYVKLCTINVSESPGQTPIQISRQSIHESLLPGLNCLREIMVDNITVPSSSSSSSNEFLQRLEQIITKIDMLQQAHLNSSVESSSSPVLASQRNSGNTNHSTPPLAIATVNNPESSLSHSPLKSSSTTSIASSSTDTTISSTSNPIGSNLINGIGGTVSSFTSSITMPMQNGAAGELTANVNNNFKSIVFKGITNFNTSKDKLSSFLNTNKTFKK